MTGNKHLAGWKFIDNQGTFQLDNPDLNNTLYFPLANEAGIFSSVTPRLHGDMKTSHNSYFSEPLSIESLHNTLSARNFWLYPDKGAPWSAAGNSASQTAAHFSDQREKVSVRGGFLWHTVERMNQELGFRSEITNFIPWGNDTVELMRVTLTNTTDHDLTLTPTAALPIYGRSADNLRDHRHVTSLLNRVTCSPDGVLVTPTLSFDERGHLPNKTTYAVLGIDSQGRKPIGFFPVVEDFIGRGGRLDWPEAIIKNRPPTHQAGDRVDGYEALGGLRFPEVTLSPGESLSWLILSAVLESDQQAESLLDEYGSLDDFARHLEKTQQAWNQLIDKLKIETANPHFDSWMRWVTCQPTLRRIFGNSFLPYHDYGRGGRGWRDLWQDSLSLLLLAPEDLGQALLNNFAGVRLDGSNATIIGSQPGDFIADRNQIPRVWMDHGAWPWLTVKLYLDQTGDYQFLLRQQPYFKDHFSHRAQGRDENWDPTTGTQQRTVQGQVYQGTLLEHLLVQHLTAFFHVGDHNNIRLEGADWNDGLDMAPDKGESPAFTGLYAGNLRDMADVILELKSQGLERVAVAEELTLLLDSLGDPLEYSDPQQKLLRLSEYFDRVAHTVSGKTIEIPLDDLAADLKVKAQHLIDHLQSAEWLEDQAGRGWFNGYYDNDGLRLEGEHPLGPRVTLTGQVFQLMGKTASDEQARQITQTVDHYLYDPATRGYRLNTNFGEVLLNMGRAFGFAYGHKENGAVFSHMAVMYANALYQRGLVKEGYQVLDGLYQQSTDYPVSQIYPGIPEYFNDRGRGMYPYLTGSASWYLLTVITRMFGVRGLRGDLLIDPALDLSWFDENGQTAVYTPFAGHLLKIVFQNPERLSPGEYRPSTVQLGDSILPAQRVQNGLLLSRKLIEGFPDQATHQLEIKLEKI